MTQATHGQRISLRKNILPLAIGHLVLLGNAVSAYSSTLEEVVVTAQKREESLQDTPISVTAFTTAAI